MQFAFTHVRTYTHTHAHHTHTHTGARTYTQVAPDYGFNSEGFLRGPRIHQSLEDHDFAMLQLEQTLHPSRLSRPSLERLDAGNSQRKPSLQSLFGRVSDTRGSNTTSAAAVNHSNDFDDVKHLLAAILNLREVEFVGEEVAKVDLSLERKRALFSGLCRNLGVSGDAFEMALCSKVSSKSHVGNTFLYVHVCVHAYVCELV